MHVNIVAEIGCNHCGNIEIAMEMMREAKSAGADFVKMQKRDLASMSDEAKNKPYLGPHSFGQTYGDHRAALEFSKEQWIELQAYANQIGIGFFATPFDINSLIFLVTELRVPYIKFGTTQMHDKQMRTFITTFQHPPLILSTGCCDEGDVWEAINTLCPAVVMQTTSCYPCEEKDVNILTLWTYRNRSRQLGLSGHYVSGNGAIEAAAVALGATWIERHFTLDRSWKGTDQAASLEPEGLKHVVKAVRTVERALGDGVKRVLDCELPTLRKIKNA